MPMKTDEPDEPSGQVPIAGRSSAKLIRGNAAVAANAPPAASTLRRVGVNLWNDFITFLPLVADQRPPACGLKLCKDDVAWPHAQARAIPANSRSALLWGRLQSLDLANVGSTTVGSASAVGDEPQPWR